MTIHPENYEDVTIYDLDASAEEELLISHNECTFMWANKEGWPVGVIMSYIWREGSFWLTASAQRARIHAVRRDPRVSICITSTGSPLPRNKTVTWKGLCTIHDSEEIKKWFYPELSKALRGDGEGAEWFAKFLDSPRRVVLEVKPTQRIAYDGEKMGIDTQAWIKRAKETENQKP